MLILELILFIIVVLSFMGLMIYMVVDEVKQRKDRKEFLKIVAEIVSHYPPAPIPPWVKNRK